MTTIPRIVVTAALSPLVFAPTAAAQVGGTLAQRPIGQPAASTRVTELARQTTLEILCRGGGGLSFENRGPSANGGGPRDLVTVSMSFRRVDRPAGTDGRGLDQGTCSIVDRAIGPMEPARIQFDISANAQIKQALHGGTVDVSPAGERYPDAKTIQTYLADPNHYWRFDAVRSGSAFNAATNQPFQRATLVAQSPAIDRSGALTPKGSGMTKGSVPLQQPSGGVPINPGDKGALNPQPLPPKDSAGALPGNALDDRAIIVIGGKQATVGELRQQLKAFGPNRIPRDSVLHDVLAADDRAIIIIGGRYVPAAAIKQALGADAAARKDLGNTPILGRAGNADAFGGRAARRDPSEREPDIRVTPTAQDVQIRFTAARNQRVSVTLYTQQPTLTDGVVTSPALLAMNLNIGSISDGFGSAYLERVEYFASARGQLKPDTRYYYAITASSSLGAGSEVGTFVTLQANAAMPPSSGGAPASGASIPGRMGVGAPAGVARQGNLSDMDDRAIIVIGGRQRTAGDVRREISQQLRTLAGPPQRFSVPARKIVDQATLPGAVQSAMQRAPSRGELGTLEIKGTATNSRAGSFEIDCVGNEPRVNTIAAPIVSGKPFTLRGNCFGDKGSLELIGQFSPRNGPFIVPVYTWTNTEIVAGMPSVDKVPDHTIAVSVLRVDGKRSDAKQARFIAERALVPVDPGFWHPTSHFSLAGVSESLDTIFGSQTFQGTGAPNRFVNRFNITINSACSLDSMDVPSTIGGVHAINGWDNGPPHSANIDIVWSPTCTTNTTDFVVGTHQVTRCAVDFELRARASCPRGINP